MSRYARKIDDNQKHLIKVFESLGATVRSTASTGSGFPDLLLYYRGRLLLVEVKDGSKTKSQRKLTPLEESFALRFPVHVVESAEQAQAMLKDELAGCCAVCKWPRSEPK